MQSQQRIHKAQHYSCFPPEWRARGFAPVQQESRSLFRWHAVALGGALLGVVGGAFRCAGGSEEDRWFSGDRLL